MYYLKVSYVAEKWGISARRVRMLCEQGEIAGVVRQGNLYLIPANAVKPFDRRYRDRHFYLKHKKEEYLNLYKGVINDEEKDKLAEDFVRHFVYNSNAMEGNTLSFEDTSKILDGIVVENHSIEEHMEVIGNSNAIRLLLRDPSSSDVLTEDLVKKINSHITFECYDDRGVYRDYCYSSLDKTKPCYISNKTVQGILEQYESKKKRMRDIYCIAELFVDFMLSQPFVKRNEKTARVVLNYAMIDNGYLPIYIKVEDKQRVLDAINAYVEEFTLEPMANLLIEYSINAYDKYFEFFREKVEKRIAKDTRIFNKFHRKKS